MLEAIRRWSKTWVVKILFGILILSFGVWGVDDVVRAVTTPSGIAKVGSESISERELDWEFQREVSRMRAMFGDALDAEKAKAMGIEQAVLARLVERLLVDQEARDLGVAISDDLVRQAIHETPAFRNTLGQFDRGALDGALRNQGLSESTFVEMWRGDMRRRHVIHSVMGGGSVPRLLAESLYRYDHQRRVAEVLRFADDAMPAPGAPDQAVLEAFHGEQAERFTAPEFRSLTVLILQAEGLADSITVTEADVQAAYEQRAGEFNTPERRTLEQVLLTDQAKALDLVAKTGQGMDLAQAAKEVGAEVIDLGGNTRDDMLPELAAAAFAQEAGVVGAPVRSPLGWHVLRVTAVEPGHVGTFEEVKDKLSAELARDKAVDLLFDQANKVEDAIGGGANLEEAATAIGGKTVKVAAIDARGLDPEGKPVAGLPALDKLARVAFETEEREESVLTEMGREGYFVLRVDAVTPAALRPLEQVRDLVLAAWVGEERRKAAEAGAVVAMEKLKGGAEMAAVAAEAGLLPLTTEPFARSGEGAPADVPANVVSRLFEAEVGETVTVRGPGASFVARLTRLQEADPATDADGLAKLRKETLDAVHDDLLDQFSASLREKFPVRVNQAAMAR